MIFNSKAKKEANKAQPGLSSPTDNCSVIATGTVIDGKLITSEDLRIEGTIKGEVNCSKKFVIGEQGAIEGEVECVESSVRGKVDGTIKVTELLHLAPSAKLEGKILAKKMIVDEGASYSGECLIGEKHVL